MFSAQTLPSFANMQLLGRLMMTRYRFNIAQIVARTGDADRAAL